MKKEALLVIDVQNIYTNEQYDYYVADSKKILSNINELINLFEEQKKLIVYIRHLHNPNGTDAGRMFDYLGESGEIEFEDGTPCVEYDKTLLLTKNGVHVIKHRYDAFIKTDLKQILEKNEIEKVVICGFMTNFCCESTARSAHDLDYYVDFVSDATGTPGTEEVEPQEIIKVVCSTLHSGYANVISTKEAIYDRTRKAD